MTSGDRVSPREAKVSEVLFYWWCVLNIYYCRMVTVLVPIVGLLGLDRQMPVPSMEGEVLVEKKVVPSKSLALNYPLILLLIWLLSLV